MGLRPEAPLKGFGEDSEGLVMFSYLACIPHHIPVCFGPRSSGGKGVVCWQGFSAKSTV